MSDRDTEIRRWKQAVTLAALGDAFSEAASDVDALLQLIATRVGDLTGDGCGVRLLSEDLQTLSRVTGGHPDPSLRAALDEVNRPLHRSEAEGLFAAVIDGREVLRISRQAPVPGYDPQTSAHLRLHPTQINLVVPLVARGRVIGVLGIVRVREAAAFDQDDEQFLRDIAQRAALAIDNASLLRNANRLADRLATGSRLAQEFSAATANLDRLLELVVRRTAEVIDEFACIRLVAPDGERFDASAIFWHADPAVCEAARRAMQTPLRVGEGRMGQVAATGLPSRIDAIDPARLADGRPPQDRADIERLGLRSLVFVPLSVGGAVIGVLCAGRRTPDRPYSDDDLALLQDICGHAALAIANSRLLADVRASERRFARLAQSGLLGIITANSQGQILDANDAVLEMIGYSRAELDAGFVPWREITPLEWRTVNQHILEQLAVSGVSRPMEMEYTRQDGTRVPVLIGVAVLESGDFITFVADLTDRKRAEKALKASEDQLRQAQKMEAVGRLAGGIAHDFNNLLSVILSLADLLAEEMPEQDPMRRDVLDIRKAGMRAAELTRQLLMFSRQQVVDLHVLDLNDVLSGMERMLPRLVGEDVDVIVRLSTRAAPILGDTSQIEQVIMNLVVNARDAMPTGGRLLLELQEADLDEAYAQEHLGTKAGPHVMLAVTDSGVGMDRETQARIFEPFFTTKPVGTGTGLGLATAFGIVKQAGGSIWVYSEPGQGSTFKIFFPRAGREVEARAPAIVGENLRGTELVLLVEDEDQVRKIAHNILARFGYRVIEARNAGEALIICERRGHEIDLLLSDVVMPQMGGPELARRLAVTRPKLRVLCMSGYTDDAVIRHGLMASGVAFLQKPLTPDKLARKVREVLDASPLAGSG